MHSSCEQIWSLLSLTTLKASLLQRESPFVIFIRVPVCVCASFVCVRLMRVRRVMRVCLMHVCCLMPVRLMRVCHMRVCTSVSVCTSVYVRVLA